MKPIIAEARAFLFCRDDLLPEQVEELESQGALQFTDEMVDEVVKEFRLELLSVRDRANGFVLMSWMTSNNIDSGDHI